jgi:hypothetical protein
VVLSNTLDVFDIFVGQNSDVSCISIDGINIASVFDILLLETDPFGNVGDILLLETGSFGNVVD